MYEEFFVWMKRRDEAYERDGLGEREEWNYWLGWIDAMAELRGVSEDEMKRIEAAWLDHKYAAKRGR